MTIARFAAAILSLSAVVFVAPPPAFAADGPPQWAYPITPPDFKPAPDDGVPRRVPNSSASYTLTQLRGASNARARERLGWTPQLSSWRQGFVQALG